tara:strand:- start:246 stop:371 length:126 start_codon:yes stop_codon:yes gene_type:complete
VAMALLFFLNPKANHIPIPKPIKPPAINVAINSGGVSTFQS